MYGIYPKEVYLIFPYDEDGIIAGVYVGSSCSVSWRIAEHYYATENRQDNQKELHKLMRDNGFTYLVVDKIKSLHESFTEYDWVDYFAKNHNIKIFNSSKVGRVNRDWLRLKKPQEKVHFLIDKDREFFMASSRKASTTRRFENEAIAKLQLPESRQTV